MNDRLSSRHIEEAVAYVCAQIVDTPEANEIASSLFNHYFEGRPAKPGGGPSLDRVEHQAAEHDVDENPAEDYRRSIDGRMHARMLRGFLAEHEVNLLREHANGVSLEDMAASRGLVKSTVHRQLHGVFRKLKAAIEEEERRDTNISQGTLRRAFGFLLEDVAVEPTARKAPKDR